MPENKQETPDLYFYTSIPKIHLENTNKYDLYERAFLKRDECNNCEYCLNTTTWD